LETPSIEYDDKLRDTQLVRAGDTAKFTVRVYGKPPPSVSWRKENREVETSPRVKVDHGTMHTSLTIAETTRRDTGKVCFDVVSELDAVYLHKTCPHFLHNLFPRYLLGTQQTLFSVKKHMSGSFIFTAKRLSSNERVVCHETVKSHVL